MKKILYLLLVSVVLCSCTEYQKALKSTDPAVKYEAAMQQYDMENYTNAIRLFEEIAPAYRGKPQAEKMFFLLSQAYFKSRQYYLAGYQFESFVSGYPKSEKVEEAYYLGAKSFAMLSPTYSLDQTDTFKAIEKLQDFIDRYPNSQYITDTNVTLKNLTDKIEKKVYENAKLYYTIGDYKAAIVALEGFSSDYPGTKYKNDALFYKLDSCYELAIKSVPSKQEERLLAAKTAYTNFTKYSSDSQHKPKADEIAAIIDTELQKFSKIN